MGPDGVGFLKMFWFIQIIFFVFIWVEFLLTSWKRQIHFHYNQSFTFNFDLYLVHFAFLPFVFVRYVLQFLRGYTNFLVNWVLGWKVL